MLPRLYWHDDAGFRRGSLWVVGGGALACAFGVAVREAGLGYEGVAAWLPTWLGIAILPLACRHARWRARGWLLFSVGASAGLLQSRWEEAFALLDGAPVFAVAEGSVLGASAGLVLALGLVPRHVRVLSWRISRARAEALRLLGSDVDSGLRALCEQALELWERIEAGSPEPAGVRTELLEAVERFFAFLARWARTAPQGHWPARSNLEARELGLVQRIEQTSDEVAREQLEQARQAVREQIQSIDAIHRNRERMLAQMACFLACIERVWLGALGQRSAGAAAQGVVLGPMLEDLARLGQDLDCVRTAYELPVGRELDGTPAAPS